MQVCAVYDEYLAVLESYQTRQWASAQFRSKGLCTLEEVRRAGPQARPMPPQCLAVERQLRDRAPSFPETHKRAVLEHVQFKCAGGVPRRLTPHRLRSINDLATELLARFREELLPDEMCASVSAVRH